MHKVFENEKLFNIYLVGGYVRDTLLEKPAKDFDYVVEPKEDVSIEIIHQHLLSIGFNSVGKDFPVYKMDDLDVALPRTEKKVGQGYYGFETQVEGVSIEDDLLRRDLTINSIAYNVITKKYVEPRGVSALKDLAQKKLRPTSKAFLEDPLRFIRLARMSSKMPDFEVIYSEFKEMLNEEVKKEIASLPKERIFAELEKVLQTSKPSNFFRVLNELEILEIVFPDIARMVGKEQSSKHHAEGDVFEHTMRVLDEATKLSSDPKVRFGALMHDIGKAFSHEHTLRENRDLKEAYYGHQDIKLTQTILEGYVEEHKYPKEYVEFAYRSSAMHHYLHGIEGLSAKKLTKMLLNITKEDKAKELEDGEIDIIAMVREIKGNKTPKKERQSGALIVSRKDLEDLITVAKADSFGRIVQQNKEGELESLNEQEVQEVFEKGKLKKSDSIFSKGEYHNDADYNKILELYDYAEKHAHRYNVVKNEQRYSVTGELIKEGLFNNEAGKLDVEKKEEYIYKQMLNLVKEFDTKYNKKEVAKTIKPQ